MVDCFPVSPEELIKHRDKHRILDEEVDEFCKQEGKSGKERKSYAWVLSQACRYKDWPRLQVRIEFHAGSSLPRNRYARWPVRSSARPRIQVRSTWKNLANDTRRPLELKRTSLHAVEQLESPCKCRKRPFRREQHLSLIHI